MSHKTSKPKPFIVGRTTAFMSPSVARRVLESADPIGVTTKQRFEVSLLPFSLDFFVVILNQIVRYRFLKRGKTAHVHKMLGVVS